jgi:hypothetical protein
VTGKWRTNEGHEYETKDCAPKRSMILCQQLYDHITCARKDYNSLRNVSERVLQIAFEANSGELLMEPETVDGEEIKLITEG